MSSTEGICESCGEYLILDRSGICKGCWDDGGAGLDDNGDLDQ